MTERVYRLVITYPEGSRRPGWRPACWSDPRFLATLTAKQRRALARQEFAWPRERRFLSSSGAYGRANLLRWYGAEVDVKASAPVRYPDDQVSWAVYWGEIARMFRAETARIRGLPEPLGDPSDLEDDRPFTEPPEWTDPLDEAASYLYPAPEALR
jgi:hypothetical protein